MDIQGFVLLQNPENVTSGFLRYLSIFGLCRREKLGSINENDQEISNIDKLAAIQDHVEECYQTGELE